MRKQFTKTMQDILYKDDKTCLLLGDIGVFGFRNEIEKLPLRVKNIGILEQSTIGVAAGYAKSGMIPFVHTIAPFLVERAYEQLKIDFGYSKLNGNFISVGGSYDYAALGCTHHCPGDVSILSNIPGMQILVPGTSKELDFLIKNNYNNGVPTYYRLSEYENNNSFLLENNKGQLIKKGSKATVVCFGNTLQSIIGATLDLDVTVLYYNSVVPFDKDLLKENYNKNIIFVEPFYEGSVNFLINNLFSEPVRILNIGVPREFLNNYGTKQETDCSLGLDKDSIYNKINLWLQ